MSLLDVKNARAEKEEHVLLNMTRQRKGRAKEIDQEARFNNTLLQKQYARKTGKVHLENKISHRVSTTKEEIVVMIENVIVGIPRIANTSRKIHWERIVRSPTYKRRNDLPSSTKRTGKAK